MQTSLSACEALGAGKVFCYCMVVLSQKDMVMFLCCQVALLCMSLWLALAPSTPMNWSEPN